MPLLLFLALGGGASFALLTALVVTDAHPLGIDSSVATWAHTHATPFWTHVLDSLTQLGSIYVVAALAIALTAAARSARVAAFLIAVIGGEEIVVNTVKALVDRPRPAFNPAAATLGPAFPSGHSANAAAFYAAAALVLGRGRDARTRKALAGLAAAIAVAVAATRVLLDLHWLTDVLGGLALGWSWFAVCGLAFSSARARRAGRAQRARRR